MTNREEEKTASPANIKMATKENGDATFLQTSVGGKQKPHELHFFYNKWPQSHELKKPVCSTCSSTAALLPPISTGVLTHPNYSCIL